MSLSWIDFFAGWRPRDDRAAPLIVEREEEASPTLLQGAGLISTALIAARTLQGVARRGGSRVRDTQLDRLATLLERALPEHLRPLIDDEIERTLAWLSRAERLPPESLDPLLAAGAEPIEALRLMADADVDSRVALVQDAIAHGMELDLEYYVPDDDTWHRVRAMALAVEPERDDGLGPLIRLRGPRGELAISARQVRWVMVVRPAMQGPLKPLGTLIRFPGRRDED